MNDTRTQEEKYAAWVSAVSKSHAKGWQHVAGWVFRSPSGWLHDLSAADLSQLESIEAKGTHRFHK